VKAGLGITVLPEHMVPAGIHPVRKEVKLPHLADAELALIKKDELSKVAEMFAEYIVQSLEHIQT
jgi:DNA-binding transcriptional LysR family regulator